MNKQVKKKCKICKKEFFVIKCRVDTAKYCSNECKWQGSYPRNFGKRMSKINKGNHLSKEHREKIGVSRISSKNPMWKGDDVKLEALHIWVAKRKLKPKMCRECGITPPYDLANKGIYNREMKNWEWLCRKCHMIKDGRLDKLKNHK